MDVEENGRWARRGFDVCRLVESLIEAMHRVSLGPARFRNAL